MINPLSTWTCSHTLTAHSAAILDLAFSPDGHTLASASLDT
ncbi:MAG: hypothetical protein ACRC8Y_24620, partial [Chroococcales cyanobacterium]